MNNPWFPILKQLKLSRAEQAAVDRYQQDPEGRGFLPVADILRSHKKIDESLELLTQGIDRHPSFTVARVVLARELFSRGMVVQAWNTLEESPLSLNDNVLAQKLKFKLGLLIDRPDISQQCYEHMRMQQMLDMEMSELGDMLALSGPDKVRARIVSDLKALGIDPLLPKIGEFSLKEGDTSPVPTPEDLFDEVNPESSHYLNDEVIEGFHVLPLNEIFQGVDEKLDVGKKGVELDSTTLADLYSRQGHFGKAMSIYRRLLRMSPNSDFLRRKIKEIAALEKEQRSDDLSVDPTIVDQMESIEIIDLQKKFFESLLTTLEVKTSE